MQACDIPLNRLYGDLASLWPLLSPPGDYAEEAAHWRRLLRRALGPGRHPILELGVGGGHNLSHLTADFAATAVDLSPAMLALSRRLNPGVTHIQGDMRTVRLDRTFKAVLIHDAISHMLTEADLAAVFQTAWEHLDPGGLMVAAPDWLRETFHEPWTAEIAHADDRMRLTVFEYTYDPDPADTRIEVLMTYLIERDGGVTIEHDRLELGLFPLATWQRSIEAAGFRFRLVRAYLKTVDQPYVLMVGRKPAVAASK